MTGLLFVCAVVDAIGKPPSGILQGALQWLGSYSECTQVRANIPVGKQAYEQVFQGKYCKTDLAVPMKVRIQNFFLEPLFIIYLCIYTHYLVSD